MAQIASGYRVSKQKLPQLIEVKENMILSNPFPLDLSKSKLAGVEGMEGLKNSEEIFEIFSIDNLSNNDLPKSIVVFGKSYRNGGLKNKMQGIKLCDYWK